MEVDGVACSSPPSITARQCGVMPRRTNYLCHLQGFHRWGQQGSSAHRRRERLSVHCKLGEEGISVRLRIGNDGSAAGWEVGMD